MELEDLDTPSFTLPLGALERRTLLGPEDLGECTRG